jgi:hypothetical protein
MKNILVSSKNFVVRHQEAILVGALTGLVIVIQYRGTKSLNEFLKDQDLWETYYLQDYR